MGNTIICLKLLKKVMLLIYLHISLAVLGLCCPVGFSLVATSGGTVSLVAVHRLLVAMASLVV